MKNKLMTETVFEDICFFKKNFKPKNIQSQSLKMLCRNRIKHSQQHKKTGVFRGEMSEVW